jgi:hypothetical protein
MLLMALSNAFDGTCQIVNVKISLAEGAQEFKQIISLQPVDLAS